MLTVSHVEKEGALQNVGFWVCANYLYLIGILDIIGLFKNLLVKNKIVLTQSVGAVEYTNCTSAEG